MGEVEAQKGGRVKELRSVGVHLGGACVRVETWSLGVRQREQARAGEVRVSVWWRWEVEASAALVPWSFLEAGGGRVVLGNGDGEIGTSFSSVESGAEVALVGALVRACLENGV